MFILARACFGIWQTWLKCCCGWRSNIECLSGWLVCDTWVAFGDVSNAECLVEVALLWYVALLDFYGTAMIEILLWLASSVQCLEMASDGAA